MKEEGTQKRQLAKILTQTGLAMMLAVTLLALLVLPACKQKGAKGTAQKVNQQAGAKTVIVRIGDSDTITWEELNDAYHLDRLGRTLGAEQVSKLLDNLINQHLVYLEGVAKGYDKNPDVVEQVERTKRQLINKYVIRDLSPQPAQITDQQIHDYYNQNPDKFKSTLINYLLFNLRKYNGDKPKALADAEKAMKALKGGKEMAKVSEEMLERKEPLTMTVRKDQKSFYGSEFDEAVWSTTEGEFGKIIETTQGYIVFKVMKRETQTLEQAEPYIRTDLAQSSSRSKMDQFYTDLRKKYPVKIDKATLESKVPKGAPGGPIPPPPGVPGLPGAPGAPFAPRGPGMMPQGRPPMISPLNPNAPHAPPAQPMPPTPPGQPTPPTPQAPTPPPPR